MQTAWRGFKGCAAYDGSQWAFQRLRLLPLHQDARRGLANRACECVLRQEHAEPNPVKKESSHGRRRVSSGSGVWRERKIAREPGMGMGGERQHQRFLPGATFSSLPCHMQGAIARPIRSFSACTSIHTSHGRCTGIQC
jgi:hypothetical protein